MLDRILTGEKRIITKKPSPKSHNWIAARERLGAKHFAKNYHIDDRCIRCGLCAKECPKGNIRMVDNRPVFDENCMLCFSYYGCPTGAIDCKSYMVIKSGYDLDALEQEAVGGMLPSIEKYRNSFIM